MRNPLPQALAILFCIALSTSSALHEKRTSTTPRNESTQKTSKSYLHFAGQKIFTLETDLTANNADNDADLNTAISSAETKTSNAVIQTQSILNAFTTQKEEFVKLEGKDVKEATEAQTEMETLEKIDETKELAEKVSSSAKKAQDSFSDAKTKAENTLKTAKPALQKAKDAQELFTKAKTNSEKKEKAEQINELNQASQDADQAIQDANAVTQSTNELKTTIQAIKDASKETKVALNQIKTVLQAKTATKSYTLAKQQYDEAIEKKKAVESLVDTFTVLLSDCHENAKNSTIEQQTIASGSKAKIDNEVNNAKSEEEKAKEKSDEATSTAEKVKTQNTVTQTEQSFQTTQSAASEVTAANTRITNALNTVNEEWKKAQKAKSTAEVIVYLAKATNAFNEAAKSKTEAAKTSASASSFVEEIIKIQNGAANEVRDAITPYVSTATSNIQTVTTKENEIAQAAAVAGTSMKALDAALKKLTEGSLDTVSESVSTTASDATSAENNAKMAKSLLDELVVASENVEKAFYTAQIIVTSAKAKSAYEETLEYRNECVKKQQTSKGFEEEIEKLINQSSDATRIELETQKDIMKNALKVIHTEVENANTAVKVADEKKNACEKFANDVKKRTAVSEAKSESETAEDALRITGEHKIKAQKAFTNAKAEEEKTHKAHCTAIAISAHANAVTARDTTLVHHETIQHKKTKVKLFVTETKKVKEEAPKKAQSDIQSQLRIVEKVLNDLEGKLRQSGDAVLQAEEYTKTTSNALRTIKATNDLAEATNQSVSAQQAATNANQEEQKAQRTLESASELEKEAGLAMDRAMEIGRALNEKVKDTNKMLLRFRRVRIQVRMRH